MRRSAAILTVAITVPFGAPVPVHLSARLPLHAGATVGDFLVAAPPRAAGDGGSIVMLRPLALGALPVPLAGGPTPSVVEVQPTLAAQASPAPVVVPPPPSLPWGAAAATVLVVAAALAIAVAVRRRRQIDPLRVLVGALAPLQVTAEWNTPAAADRLARACREFLQVVTDAPCPAMTTRELARLLATRLDAATARSFGLALVLADEVRFADRTPAADDAVTLVRDLLAAAPTLMPATGRVS